jgi:hypothetical protein
MALHARAFERPAWAIGVNELGFQSSFRVFERFEFDEPRRWQLLREVLQRFRIF